MRIPIGKKGEAGEAELVAHGAPGDDFDFDRNDAAYITTHPFNSVLKVTDKGVESVIANAEDGVIGPTSAAIVDTDNGTALYVVTDGGLYAPRCRHRSAAHAHSARLIIPSPWRRARPRPNASHAGASRVQLHQRLRR
ncbi:MAG: hypothetical protein R3C55_05855 [Parvularculaceae bacterium]